MRGSSQGCATCHGAIEANWRAGRGAYLLGRLRQNNTSILKIYIGHPISILDIRYLYLISDIQYPTG